MSTMVLNILAIKDKIVVAVMFSIGESEVGSNPTSYSVAVFEGRRVDRGKRVAGDDEEEKHESAQHGGTLGSET